MNGKTHNVFLGDLEIESIDPLGLDEFENGRWESTKATTIKDKKLSPSTHQNVVDYFDQDFDYMERDKVYNELMADVSKGLEYKEEKKKGAEEGKKSRWGRRNRQEEERQRLEKEREAKQKALEEAMSSGSTLAPPELNAKNAADVYAEALKGASTAVDHSKSKAVQPTEEGMEVGRSEIAPQGAWADAEKVKLYVVPIGLHRGGYEAAAQLLDELVAVLQQDSQHVFT